MLVYRKGFVAYVLKINSNVKIEHCMIYREALVTKALPEKLRNFRKRGIYRPEE
jgi:hypothetical protein